MAGDPAIGAVREAREGAKHRRNRAAARKRREQVGRRSSAGPHLPLRGQVPRLEAPLGRDAREEALPLLVLDRDWPQPPAAIPGEDLVQRPFAESAVAVVEDRELIVRRAHREGYALDVGAASTARTLAARSVLARSIAIVMGPTPPGTGVIAPATSLAASKSTSPTSPSSVRLMPTSTTAAPGLTQSPLTMRGDPTAATRMSARRQTAGRS